MDNSAKCHITRDFGHPWTRKPGWDLLEAKEETQADLDKFISDAEQKFWQIWSRDDTGQVAMYKPSGAKAAWVDNPK